MSKFDFIKAELSRRKAKNQLRRLRAVSPVSGAAVQADGKSMVNFCSNDYLGLSKHPLLQRRAAEFTECYGTGSTASRLICGTYDYYERIESRLAELKGTEGALIMNSGFQANVTMIPSLIDSDALIISDRLNHNSIIQGILLSRCHKRRYDHSNLDHLEQILSEQSKGPYSRILIITESIFSMDGDQSDIDGLISLADKYQAILVVDEAHATGVIGRQGMGLTAGKGVDITIGTFGKALGSFGAYIACSNQIRDYLINCCAGFIYTTALPPAVVGAIDAALDLIPKMDAERQRLWQYADHFRNSLNALGYDTAASNSQIVPVIIGDEKETLALSSRLEENGFLATAIRPPTVPINQSRIRISLSATHSKEQVEALINVFKK